jgi:hypothetical protein
MSRATRPSSPSKIIAAKIASVAALEVAVDRRDDRVEAAEQAAGRQQVRQQEDPAAHAISLNSTFMRLPWQGPGAVPKIPCFGTGDTRRPGRDQGFQMRLSEYPIQSLKEVPADAEIVSHRLMLRAGPHPAPRRRPVQLACRWGCASCARLSA